MSRTKRVLELVTLATILCCLTGCPLFFPVLNVNPAAVHFDPTDEIRTFRIANAGAGTLTWEASTDDPGVFMNVRLESAKQGSSSLTGSITNQVAVIEITVDRQLLPKSGADVQITSNGGTATVLITASASEQGEPTFDLNVGSLDFSISETNRIITIRNNGSIPLTWEVDTLPDWVELVPDSGVVGPNQSQNVTVTVDRTGLIPGDYDGIITFNTNAGPASLPITMIVPPFSASPTLLDFGTISLPAILDLDIISNFPPCPVGDICNPLPISITTTTENNVNWITLDTTSVSLPVDTATTISVTADPTLVGPGTHQGQIILTDTNTQFVFTVDVIMIRSSLIIAPPVINFGGITVPETATFTVQNIGDTVQTYNVVAPSAQSSWLSITGLPSDLSIAPGETDTFTITANPLNVQAGTFGGDILVTFQGGQDAVRVLMIAEKNPDLVVTPQTIDFSLTRTQESVGIINGGTFGTINWSIDTTNFPNWLTLRPIDTNGQAGGVLNGGGAAQSIILEVDRSVIPDGVPLSTFSFNVLGTGDVNEIEVVTVSVSKTLLPAIVVEGKSTSLEGIEQLVISVGEDSGTFVIRNEGLGLLDWNIIGIIDPEDPNEANILPVPPWITGISPQQDTLDPSIQQNVTINISRNNLNFLGARATLLISSNDPNNPLVPLFVEVIVPKVAVIGARPQTLAFGEGTITSFFEVANLGDPDTELVYVITVNKNWLSIFPTEGRSFGTATIFKDWKLHSVSVDRALLTEAGDSATITISALKAGTSDVVDATIAKVTISVIVQVPQLTIESPKAHLRVPSLVRHHMTLRDLRNRVITLSDANMPSLLKGISVFENDVPVEVTEDQKFVKKATPVRARTNALILLDYSNSMQTSAKLDPDVTISGAPDPLQALYERTISQLIQELPPEYAIGLAIFNERSAFVSSTRPVTNSSAETASTLNKLFIKDKNVLLQRLDDIVVLDNGATELIPALTEASFLLFNDDFNNYLQLPFDEADIRALICVTDGRQTTPPSAVAPLGILMTDFRIKFLPVGWGDQIQFDTLIQLSSASGGHMYSTTLVDVLDTGGEVINRLPSVSTLENWTTTLIGDDCDQSIAKDLSNQVLFNYVSLNESNSASIKVNVSFNNPNDTQDPQTGLGGCLDDQGVISNSIEYGQYPMLINSGDVNLGQINLETQGVVTGAGGVDIAEIFINLDAAPRNMSAFQFTYGIDTNPPDLLISHELVLKPDSGVVSDWVPSLPPPAMAYQSPDGSPLLYGEFGRLIKVTVRHQTQGMPIPDFRFNFNVISPAFSTGAVNEKYIIAPDSIFVRRDAPFKATSFPRQMYENFSVPPRTPARLEFPIEIDLGSNIPVLSFDVVNRGGSHAPTNVFLGYTLDSPVFDIVLNNVPGESISMLISDSNTFPLLTPIENKSLFSTFSSDDVFAFPDRTILPGSYVSKIEAIINFGSMSYPGANPTAPILVYFDVLPSALSVAPADTDIILGPGTPNYTVTITNIGQSTLVWTIDDATFPDWLTVSDTGGSLNALAGNSNNVTFFTDRTNLPPNSLPLSHNFTINSNGGTFNATITLRDGAFVITPDISDIQVFGANSAFLLNFKNTSTTFPVDWQILNPTNLPAWLTFSSNSGTIAAGGNQTVNVQVGTPPALPVTQSFQILGDGLLFNGQITVNP